MESERSMGAGQSCSHFSGRILRDGDEDEEDEERMDSLVGVARAPASAPSSLWLKMLGVWKGCLNRLRMEYKDLKSPMLLCAGRIMFSCCKLYN